MSSAYSNSIAGSQWAVCAVKAVATMKNTEVVYLVVFFVEIWAMFAKVVYIPQLQP